MENTGEKKKNLENVQISTRSGLISSPGRWTGTTIIFKGGPMFNWQRFQNLHLTYLQKHTHTQNKNKYIYIYKGQHHLSLCSTILYITARASRPLTNIDPHPGGGPAGWAGGGGDHLEVG